jgi:PPOX class probable F420-dependent enzyme
MSNTPRIADARYVALTTYKRDGTAKILPVWIADLGDGTVGFTTSGESYKVKRIANDPRVVLQQSNSRGQVVEGSTPVEGTAEVVTGADFERVLAAITAKYGWQLRLILLAGKVRSLFGSPMRTDTGVVVTVADT